MQKHQYMINDLDVVISNQDHSVHFAISSTNPCLNFQEVNTAHPKTSNNDYNQIILRKDLCVFIHCNSNQHHKIKPSITNALPKTSAQTPTTMVRTSNRHSELDQESSTLDAYEQSSSKATEHTRKRRLQHHSVRFDEGMNQEYRYYTSGSDTAANSHHLSDDDLWYQDSDFCRFKQENKEIIKRVLQEEKWNEESWSFYKTLRVLYSISSEIEYELDDAFAVMCPKQQLLLKQLSHLHHKNANAAPDTIGLEKSFVPCIKKDLEKRVEALQDVVAEIQSEYDQGFWSDAQLVAELRECCRNYSQAPCLFAQLLGRLRSQS